MSTCQIEVHVTTYAISQLMSESGVKFGTSGARGLVAQMTDAVCYAYTAAFLQATAVGCRQVVLGHDLRPSSPRMSAACAAAVSDAGMEIIYAGALPTPALAFFAASLGAPAVVVTGSHIPFDRNGIKYYRPEGEITKADEQAILSASIQVPDGLSPLRLPEPDGRARRAYIGRYVDFFGAGTLVGRRIAIYEHSSVARDVLAEILAGLGAEVISLGRTDTFVPIDTEAVRAQDVAQAQAWAAEYGFDAILSTDGDADRPLIGDERGHWFRGDMVGILCSQYLHADVVVTPVSSNTAVEKCGLFSKVLRTRIGSPYVIAGMVDCGVNGTDKVIVGYEANGGFLLGSDILRDNHSLVALPTRDAVLPMLALLSMAHESGGKLSELPNGLPARFTASDRIQNFAAESSRGLIEHLSTDLAYAAKLLAPDAGGVVDTNVTDGLRVMFATGDIVHLRPSGNAPELRCYAESGTSERAQALCDGCLGRIAQL